MKLTKKEAEVIEMIRNGVTRKDITRILKISNYALGNIISNLAHCSAIRRSDYGKGGYKVIVDTYDIDNNKEQILKPKKMIKVVIPEEHEIYIRNQYGLIPRREIARELNLDKVTLNLMIMNLGLGGKEVLQN